MQLESLVLFFIKDMVLFAGRTQNTISIWSSGHATCSSAKDAHGTEERLGSNGFLHIFQGWIFLPPLVNCTWVNILGLTYP